MQPTNDILQQENGVTINFSTEKSIKNISYKKAHFDAILLVTWRSDEKEHNQL
jgi:hypothetical protein